MGHGHGHGHGCTADHHRGEYTERQRADLDLVLAFNHRLAQAVVDCTDITDTVAALDPDPLRYMWVDEGDGQIPTQLARAAAVLDAAPQLLGQTRGGVRVVEGSGNAARPSVATHGGDTLVGWLEWQPERGDRLLAELSTAAQRRVTTVVEGPEDLFRPTAVITADGTPWLLFGRSVAGRVGVWACRFDGTAWSAPEPVSDTEGPSFNQEACAHPDGSLHVCWQGRVGDRFGIFARRWHAGSWADTEWVSEGAAGNVWDPALAATPDGMAYAWAEYAAGSYAVVLRGPAAGPARRLTGGTDYALHPSLAATADGRLWCAFDVITVHGHGGSGPTRLRPRPEYGRLAEEQDGMREPGASVPPELLPEVSAGIRVVCVDGDGLVQPPGELAPGLNVTPSALPRLQATADGGLVVGYRVHRQLPLMTYYWEAAVQVLGPDGWQAPTTFSGTDATLEELSLAAADGGVVLATQSDGRLERALHWTEGFGGRECPYLADHHGAVIWHGVHGAGQVVLGAVASTGPAATGWGAGRAARLRRPAGGAALGGRATRRGALPGAGRRGHLPAVLGRPAPALAGQPVHRPATSRRWRTSTATPGTSTSTTSGRSPTTPRTPPPTSGGASRRSPTCCTCPAGSCRSTGSSGPRPTAGTRTSSTATWPAAPRSSPRSPRAPRPRTGCGAAWPSTPSSRRSPSRTTPARPWCTTTGTTTTRATAGWSRCSRRAGATTSPRPASGSTPTAPPPARS